MNLSADWLMQAGLRATLLLAGLFLLWRFLPVSRPALRRQVLLGIAAALLIAPWLSGWWSFQATPAGIPTSSIPDSVLPVSWPHLVACLWLTGTGLALLRLTLAAFTLHRLIRRARPWTGSPALPDLTVLQSSAISGPCVARGRKPVLLLPESARRWTPSQWEMVLAHETQHLRQQDLRLSWLPRLVHCLYWWHPLAHWLTRQFHAESEALCDHAVLARSGHGPREYVEFLLSLNAARMPAHAIGMAMKSPLGKRIERLFPSPQHPKRRAAAGALLVLTGIAALSFSLKTIPPIPTDGMTSGATEPAQPPAQNAGTEEINQRLSANPFPEDNN